MISSTIRYGGFKTYAQVGWKFPPTLSMKLAPKIYKIQKLEL
ncbi:hypothetical protein NEIFL0001_1805 [Neisseria flavescens SK114]|nr:hypothetical protein NEIFL0001_1805 [Neisseria flavescens SK114]